MVIINKKITELIKTHAKKEFPEISCGAVLGVIEEDKIIVRNILELKNQVYENRSERYLISPAQFFETEKYAEINNLSVIGFYHTSSSEEPSQIDLKLAHPYMLYFLIPIENGRVSELKAWSLTESRKSFSAVIIKEENIVPQEYALAI